jgi:hypothetical protein
VESGGELVTAKRADPQGGAPTAGRSEGFEELVDAVLETAYEASPPAGHEASPDRGEASPPERHTLSAATAGAAALRHIAALTAREPIGVTLVEPEDSGWVVNVEVIEDRRIPSSGDIPGLYTASLDQEGDLISYRRLRRYRRGTGDMNNYGAS